MDGFDEWRLHGSQHRQTSTEAKIYSSTTQLNFIFNVNASSFAFEVKLRTIFRHFQLRLFTPIKPISSPIATSKHHFNNGQRIQLGQCRARAKAKASRALHSITFVVDCGAQHAPFHFKRSLLNTNPVDYSWPPCCISQDIKSSRGYDGFHSNRFLQPAWHP